MASVSDQQHHVGGRSSPSTISWPVRKPITSTAGIVRLIVASTEPSRMLTERCSSFASAARMALTDSGDMTRTATSRPPERRRRVQHVDAVVDRHRELLCEQTTGSRCTTSKRAVKRDRAEAFDAALPPRPGPGAMK